MRRSIGKEGERREMVAQYAMQRANTLLLLGSIFFLAGVSIVSNGIYSSKTLQNSNIFSIFFDKYSGLALIIAGFALIWAGASDFFKADKTKNWNPELSKMMEELLLLRDFLPIFKKFIFCSAMLLFDLFCLYVIILNLEEAPHIFSSIAAWWIIIIVIIFSSMIHGYMS